MQAHKNVHTSCICAYTTIHLLYAMYVELTNRYSVSVCMFEVHDIVKVLRANMILSISKVYTLLESADYTERLSHACAV